MFIRNIFIIDEDPRICDRIARVCRRHDFRTYVFTNPYDAMYHFLDAKQDVHLGVFGLHLGEQNVNGIELYLTMKQKADFPAALIVDCLDVMGVLHSSNFEFLLRYANFQCFLERPHVEKEVGEKLLKTRLFL